MIEKITIITCDKCGANIQRDEQLKDVSLNEAGNGFLPPTDINTQLCLTCFNELISIFENKFGGQ